MTKHITHKPSSPLHFRDLRLPSEARVLALGPHPDDFDAVGITMKRLRDNGNPIHVAVLTASPAGVLDEFVTPPTDEVKGRVRLEEQRRSCHFFGLPEEQLEVLQLDLGDDGQLTECAANRERIRGLVAAWQPALVFLPHWNDPHLEHQRTYALFAAVMESVNRPTAAFLCQDPKTIDLRVDVVTTFTETEAAWKGELLRCHASQHQRNLATRGHGFDERILGVNRRIARDILGIDGYAEAFQLHSWNGWRSAAGCLVTPA